MHDDTPILDPIDAYALWAASYPPHAHNPFMRCEERALLSLLPADLRGRAVLDAGCGSGRYMLHARRRGAACVLGIDLSAEMLARARELGVGGWGSEIAFTAPNSQLPTPNPWLVRGSLDALPIRDGWADLTLCGLTLGHLADLDTPLAELRRVTRTGGTLVCSDFHPIGHTLGWRREFKAAGRRYAVRHTPHTYGDWQHACRGLNLRIVEVLEPRLDPADIPPGALFDPAGLEVPVAFVFELRREG